MFPILDEFVFISHGLGEGTEMRGSSVQKVLKQKLPQLHRARLLSAS